MKHKLLLWKLYCLKNREQGFAISLAIMFGLLFILAATVLLGSSFKSESKQTANQLGIQSNSIARSIITQYKDLINNNPGMAAYDACGDDGDGKPERDTSGNCTSTEPSWSNPDSINNALAKKINSDYTASSDEIKEIPLCDNPTFEHLIGFADTNWDDFLVNSGTAESRLIHYDYDSSKSEGILTVEARVAGGSDTAERVGTSVARYQATIPIETRLPYGLWYHKNQESTIHKAQIGSNIYDSTCAENDKDRITVANSIKKARDAQKQARKNQVVESSYIMTPEIDMPDVDTVPKPKTPDSTTNVTSENPSPGKFSDPLEIPSNEEVTLKSGVYEFPGIEITDDGKLIISGGGLVEIRVTGDMVISGKVRNAIEVASGTKAIFYVDGSIQVSGEAEIENSNEGIEYLQIYAYGTGNNDSGNKIELLEQSRLNNVFLLGDKLPLVVSGTTQFLGTAWVKSFIDNNDEATGDTVSYDKNGNFVNDSPLFVQRQPTSYSDLKVSESPSPDAQEEKISLKQLGDTPKSLTRLEIPQTP